MKFFAQVALVAASVALILAEEVKDADKTEVDSKQQDKRGLLGLGYGYPGLSSYGVHGVHGAVHGVPHAQPYAGVPTLVPGVLYGQDIGYTRSYYTAAAAHPYGYGHHGPHPVAAGYHHAPAPAPAHAPYGAYSGVYHKQSAYHVPSLPYGGHPAHPTKYDPAYPAKYDPAYPAKYDPAYPTKYDPAYPSKYEYDSKPGYSVYGRLPDKKYGSDYSYGYKASDYSPYSYRH